MAVKPQISTPSALYFDSPTQPQFLSFRHSSRTLCRASGLLHVATGCFSTSLVSSPGNYAYQSREPGHYSRSGVPNRLRGRVEPGDKPLRAPSYLASDHHQFLRTNRPLRSRITLSRCGLPAHSAALQRQFVAAASPGKPALVSRPPIASHTA